MKKVAIYGQSYSISAEKEIQILLDVLEANSIVSFIEIKFYTLLVEGKILSKKYPTFSDFSDLNSSFEAMFTLGGDGTILRAVTYIRNLNIPILGINVLNLVQGHLMTFYLLIWVTILIKLLVKLYYYCTVTNFTTTYFARKHILKRKKNRQM